MARNAQFYTAVTMTPTSALTLTVLSLFTGLASGYHDASSPTTKTYDLQVPGSSPIRIIEGDPYQHRHHAASRAPATEDSYEASTTLETRTSLNGPILSAEEYPEDTVGKNDTEALRRFLKKFADNLKKHRAVTTTRQPDRNLHQRFDEVKLIERPRDGTSLYAVEKPSSVEDGKEKDSGSKSWDLVKMQKHESPLDRKQGWVSLEAVPWSVSKVSKWQSHYRPGANDKVWEEQPSEGYGQQRPDYGSGSHKNKPSVVYNPGSITVHQTKPFNPYQHENSPFQQSNPRPPLSRPPSSYVQEVIQQQYHDPGEAYYGSHNKRPATPYCDNKDHHPSFYQNHHHSEIITDGRPANFPAYKGDNRRQDAPVVSDPDLSEDQDFGGHGEWVLLSTTKGYKYPKQRQRSMRYESAANQVPEEMTAHKMVKLTVLPPKKGSKVNMTTSHGGLLQVESSFQTVEEAKRDYQKAQRLKMSSTRRPAKKANLIKQVEMIKPVQKKPGPDPSTVMAAVGAGMIPATMAMLVPMAMGGRRRKRDLRFVTRRPLVGAVEIQLQSSL